MRSDALGIWWQDEPVVKILKPPPPKKVAPERTWERPDYLPGLAEAIAFDVPLYTFDEMLRNVGETLLFDIEIYANYFCICFMSYNTGRVAYFELYDGHPLNIPALEWVVRTFELVSFNGIKFDQCILALALAGKGTDTLKEAANQIIEMDVRPQDILRSHKVKTLRLNHVDLIEVAPLRASLKIYGGRLHTPKMQDLPFHHKAVLSWEQMRIVLFYCVNDLMSTGFLRHALKDECHLRVQLSDEYGQDLRSRSDAQIAEHVIADEVSRLNGERAKAPDIPIGTQYFYQVPRFITYESALLNWALDKIRGTAFVVDHTGSVGMPDELKDLKLTIGGGCYRMGIGGLHSSESSVAHFADEHTLLEEVDVVSYYPFIILLLGLFPKHLGPNFLKIFGGLVKRRVAAKNAGQSTVADSLKIVVNGTFGKLGSMFSVMYAPDLLIQVTLTGQLALLMLIERLELTGIPVVSANTDGLVIKCPAVRKGEMQSIVKGWELDTGFETENAAYKALFSKDVNNYIGVLAKPKKGKFVKTKGAYADTGLKKNPTNQIVTDAVIELLVNRVPVEYSIPRCKDIRKFVQVRTVKGGAVKVYSRKPAPAHSTVEELIRIAGFSEVADGQWQVGTSDMAVLPTDKAYARANDILSEPDKIEYLGKAIRWYYATGVEDAIIYAMNGHDVPRSKGARPLMTLPKEMPTDVDYDRYIEEARGVLEDIGYYG